jgi:hypothetical protein
LSKVTRSVSENNEKPKLTPVLHHSKKNSKLPKQRMESLLESGKKEAEKRMTMKESTNESLFRKDKRVRRLYS